MQDIHDRAIGGKSCAQGYGTHGREDCILPRTAGFTLIVGCDFQVKDLIGRVLAPGWAGDDVSSDVVLVTGGARERIRGEISSGMDDEVRRRLRVVCGDMTRAETYCGLRVTGAREIFLMGDGEDADRDGNTLLAQKRIVEKAWQELGGEGSKGAVEPPEGFEPIPLYLHIEDSALYTRLRAMELPSDPPEVGGRRLRPVFRTEVFNYYESWAWRCWADRENDLPCLHLMRSAAKRVELFVIGASRMGSAMVNFALPLMNYGLDGKRSRVTIFDADPQKEGFLPDREVLEELPEVEVIHSACDGGSDEANDAMLAAAQREDTAVTIVVALPEPVAAVRVWSKLSSRLQGYSASVLVWQATHSAGCPDEGIGSGVGPVGGVSFGMTDVLPWYDAERRMRCGAAVNYYYDHWRLWESDPEKMPPQPKFDDPDFVGKALAEWDEDIAEEGWRKTLRWRKWASVRSADAFRERSVLFEKTAWADACLRVLKAEHNRWWTERLLSGWRLDERGTVGDGSHADATRMLHGDMVPFERLTDAVRDKDKVSIAAMAARGFIAKGCDFLK